METIQVVRFDNGKAIDHRTFYNGESEAIISAILFADFPTFCIISIKTYKLMNEKKF